MFGVQNRSMCSLLAVCWVGATLSAPFSADAQTIPADVRAELDRLRTSAPSITTFEARYRIENVSTVDGHDSSFVQEGRIYIGPGSVCIFKDVAPNVPEAQILYSLSDGTCLRYFPFSGYGHRVAKSSLDNQSLDFSKFWRPLLAYLFPETEIKRMPSLAKASSLVRDGITFSTIRARPDQAREASRRAHARRLEHWKPPPDMTYFASPNSGRIERVEAVHYMHPKFDRSELTVSISTSARLHNKAAYSGVVIPTTLTFESRVRDHEAPHRRSTVTLTNVKVNQELPVGALEPIWPDDTIFLDVENQFADAYLATSSDPASMINLADYYFATHQRAEGLNWLTRFIDSIGARTPTPPEAANLARLFSLAGRSPSGEKVFRDAVTPLEQRVADNHDPADELLLVRYYTQQGYFRVFSRGLRSNAEAASYLEDQVGKLRTPIARARLCGRIAEHYTAADRYDDARGALNSATTNAVNDRSAQEWIDCCRKRIDFAQQRDVQVGRIRAKHYRIDDLRRRLVQWNADGDAQPESERQALEVELQRLQTNP